MAHAATMEIMRPDCYMGVKVKDGIIVGSFKSYDPVNKTVTLSKSLKVDTEEYMRPLVGKTLEERVIPFQNESKLVLGKTLLYDVGGEEKLDEILDAFDIKLTKEGIERFKEYRAAQKGPSISERMANYLEGRRLAKQYAKEHPSAKPKTSWFTWNNFKEVASETGAALANFYSACALGPITPLISYAGTCVNGPAECVRDFEMQDILDEIEGEEDAFKVWFCGTLGASIQTVALGKVIYEVGQASNSAEAQAAGVVVCALPLTVFAASSIVRLGGRAVGVVQEHMEELKAKREKDKRMARILQAVCPIRYEGGREKFNGE